MLPEEVRREQVIRLCRKEATEAMMVNGVMGATGGAVVGGATGSLVGASGGLLYGYANAPNVHDECMRAHGEHPLENRSRCTIL